jgi:GTP-binding protein Era
MADNVFKSGVVSLTGLPNAGKSTLLNQLAGMQLAITSPKPQTTRQVIRAIIDEPDSQIVFLDTPGFHSPKSQLDRYMLSGITAALTDCDIIVLVTDSIKAARSKQIPALEKSLLARVKKLDKPVILLLNKIDQVRKDLLLPLIARYDEAGPFAAIIPVSARKGDGVELMLAEIRRLLQPGPHYFPVDSLTDQTERSLAAELIREQVLLLTHEEIPHGVAVEIESFLEKGEPERDFVEISAVIYCDRESHKGILIGKQGAMLKQIGTRARQKIEEMTGTGCYLELFVKVREGWRNRQDILHSLGLTSRM